MIVFDFFSMMIIMGFVFQTVRNIKVCLRHMTEPIYQ